MTGFKPFSSWISVEQTSRAFGYRLPLLHLSERHKVLVLLCLCSILQRRVSNYKNLLFFKAGCLERISAFLQRLPLVQMSLSASPLRVSTKGPGAFSAVLIIGNEKCFPQLFKIWQHFLSCNLESKQIWSNL